MNPHRNTLYIAFIILLLTPFLTSLLMPQIADGQESKGQTAMPETAAGGSGVVASPLSLTSSDGSGLKLVSLEARAVLVPPLAFTELRLAFDNPQNRQIEGRFRMLLPPGATVSRFAMEIEGQWQEGEVVERQRARQVYEDFLYRRQDPALLEQQPGNEFTARVFPIPARGRKNLIVSWSHELTRPDQPFRIPLAGLPQIGQLDLRVLVSRTPAESVAFSSDPEAQSVDYRVITLAKRQWTPDRDFEVAQPKSAASGLRHGDLLLVRVKPELDESSQPLSAVVVLVDTSASRALDFERQLTALRQIIAGLAREAGARKPVLVVAFDQTADVVFEGPAASFGQAHMKSLRQRGAMGASDLHGALGWLDEHLRPKGTKYARMLLLSDGVVTAGKESRADLGAAVSGLAQYGVQRLDAVASGGLRDDAMLSSLVVASGLPHAGLVLEATLPQSELFHRLSHATASGLEVEIEGSSWQWPRHLDGVQDGDSALIYAQLPAHQAPRVKVGGQLVDLGEIQPAPKPLLERAVVKARIDRLLALREGQHADEPDIGSAMAREIVELSVRHRVLSPFTALLVLETHEDYRRYGIDRDALSDILSIGLSGLEVAERGAIFIPPAGFRNPPEVSNAAPAADQELMIVAAEEEVFKLSAEGHSEDLFFETPSSSPPPPSPHSLLTSDAAAEPSVARSPSPSRPAASRARQLGQQSESDTLLEDSAQVAHDGRSAPLTVEEQIIVTRPSGISSPPASSPPAPQIAPYSGPFADIMAQISNGKADDALVRAEAWRLEQPGDLLAWVALGEACEAAGRTRRAARAYGSLIDLFPGRADLRRYAAGRLERLEEEDALTLAVDSYQRALDSRPDHPSGHRLLAFALLKNDQPGAAFELLAAVLSEDSDSLSPRWDRFPGVRRLLLEDLGLVAAVWRTEQPKLSGLIDQRLATLGASLATGPSLRFVLTWETAANDVDLHIHDARGGHASYQEKMLPSGGELYADVTEGFGPEAFVIAKKERARAHPYRLRAHYYSRGPMGYGLGKLQVIEHDGHGHLRFDERPFVVMQDDAYVELGEVRSSKR